MTLWAIMTKLLLVNMPFAAPAIPSLALTQLKAVVPAGIQAEILHLNHDFAKHIGDLAAYRHVLSDYGFMTGIGDWFFRQVAFPDAPDNRREWVEKFSEWACIASTAARIVPHTVPIQPAWAMPATLRTGSCSRMGTQSAKRIINVRPGLSVRMASACR